MTSTEFTVGATDRANKVLAFDSSGEISVTQELGTFKGTDATVTTAAYVQRDIIKSTTSAQLNNIYICVADSVVGDSLTDTDHFELLVDAVSAATSATAAATSATASATSATASASSATTSGNSATASASSATAAANSATAAASSATDAANSADAFDDIYLGSKSSDPSTDNDGDALAAGMLYFNTTDDLLRVYTGSAWQNAAVDTTGFITLSGTQTLTNKTLTTPKIGTSILDTNGNELAKLTATGSAVNEFTVANAATGGSPTLSATGGDSNIDLDLLAKGTGHVTVRGNTNAGAIQLNCESNSHGQIVKSQPHSAAVTNEMLLPAGASSTLVSLVSTDTLTNKTLTSPKIGTKIDDTNGNELVNLTATGSAVNEFTIANAATGNNPVLSATGGDSNVGIEFTTKGTGTIKFNDLAYIPQQALTSSSNAVAWDTQAKPNAYHLTTENTTFAAPTNNTEGSFICLEINYNGSHTIAFNTVFEFAASTAPTFTSTDGKTDILVFRYNGAVWQEVGRTLNLSES
nr:gp7 [uncultured Mediterranean phage uvMED]